MAEQDSVLDQDVRHGRPEAVAAGVAARANPESGRQPASALAGSPLVRATGGIRETDHRAARAPLFRCCRSM